MMIYLKYITSLGLIFFFSGMISVKAQETVRGTVTDAVTGLPVNTAQIICGEYANTFTQEDGSFSITLPYADAVLSVQSVGYRTQTVPAKRRKTINVQLISNQAGETDKIYIRTGKSFENRLQQQFGEMRTIVRSGAPSAGGNLFIRGFNSITASSQPLILVDGIPCEMLHTNRETIINGSFIDPLANIAPEDIEDVRIIKDGYALYGVKGANGVIAITTKRAKEQTSRISFSSYLGVNTPPRHLPVLGANDFRTFITEQTVSSGVQNLNILDYVYLNDNPANPDYYTYHNNTDWQNEIYRNGAIQNYHAEVTGGDEIAKYAIMLGYADNNSPLKNASFNRFNARFNTDIDLSKTVTLSLGVSYSQTDRELRDDGVVFRSSPSYLALIKSPLVRPLLINSDGVELKTLSDKDIWNVSNPAVLQSDATVGENAQERLGIYGKLNWHLTSNWMLNATLSYDYDKAVERYFIPDYGTSEEFLERINEISKRIANDRSMRYSGQYVDLSARYKKMFRDIHLFHATAGLRYQSNGFEMTGGSGNNSAQDKNPYLETKMIGKMIYGNRDYWKWVSAYLDASYSLKERYFLSFSLSEDGSSRAGANRQYALFPSAGLTWNLSAEPFLANASCLSNLQLRANAGIVGNDNFSYLTATGYFQSTDFMNMKGLTLSNLDNPDLKWETTRKTNVGLDISLFNDRISVSADFFLNHTNDLILPQTLDKTTGFNTVWINGGELENKGAELQLGLRLIDTRNFKWIARLSATKYKNKVTALPGNQSVEHNYPGAGVLTQVGQPLGVFYGYKSSGVFTTAEAAHKADLYTYYKNTYKLPFEAGDIRFQDTDGNHLIDENDRQIIGDPNPDFYGSLATSFMYKNISLDVVFTGVYGNDVYNYLRAQMENMEGFRNQSASILNRWKVEGQQTNVPRSDYYDSRGNGRFSDRWIEDGSYLRLKNLTLTWKYPKKLLFLDGFSLFASVDNVFVLTRYLGADPEFSPSNSAVFQGIDAGYLSQGRSFTGGFKINL